MNPCQSSCRGARRAVFEPGEVDSHLVSELSREEEGDREHGKSAKTNARKEKQQSDQISISKGAGNCSLEQGETPRPVLENIWSVKCRNKWRESGRFQFS